LEQKAIVFPSGDQAGLTSSHTSPDVNCFASPLSASTSQTCARSSGRKPASSRLKKTRVILRETTPSFFFCSSSSRSIAAASFARNWRTKRVPSGDQAKDWIEPFRSVSRSASPPATGMT